MEPTVALRVGDALSYCTDTAPDPGNVILARGSQVLLHEAWYAEETSADEFHSAAGDAGMIARQAGVERLLLIHIHPLQDSEETLAEYARREFPNAKVAVDLDTIVLP